MKKGLYPPLCFLMIDITTELRVRRDDLMAIQQSPIVLSRVPRDLIRMRVLQEDESLVAGRPQSALRSLSLPAQMKAAAALEATMRRCRP